jgi:peptidoglycan/LPS O-acetylase OafA/YrhL
VSTRSAPADRPLPELAGHVPALDGIRGLAILMVMVYHLTLLPGGVGLDRVWASVAAFGWAGVDLFFVLSGFLITGILWEARGSRHYFRNFYARRTLRIFPLYYAVIVLLLVVLPRLPHAQAARYGAVGSEQVWYWTYLSNFAIGLRHEWNLGSLDVSWSLAIEEQFYLVWPAVVLLLDRRALMRFCVGVIGVAVLTRTVLTLAGVHPIAVNVLTPCRLDALAVGAFLALAVRGTGGIAVLLAPARPVAAVSLLLLAGLFAVQGPKWGVVRGPGQLIGYSLLAVFYGCVLLLGVSRRGRGLNRFFSSRLLTTFGHYSYALYLFHLPISVCLRETVLRPGHMLALFGSHLPGQLLFYAAGIGLSLAAAWLSWRFYEGPILSLKRFFPAAREPWRQVCNLPSSNRQVANLPPQAA